MPKIQACELYPLLWKGVIPPLSHEMHKGQGGKIGVVGGSFEYTGAPYYSAYSALKVGADIAQVFCTEDAAVPIKSYSPELIVHPVVASDGSKISCKQSIKQVCEMAKRLSAIVIGPGLGRDETVMDVTSGIIQNSKEFDIPLILDGDALWLLSKNKELIKDHPNCVLLPNPVEFKRLQSHEDQTVKELAKELGALIVEKGKTDTIVCGNYVTECSTKNSPRRCGGQGDLLAGSMGVFMSWANKFIQTEDNMNTDKIRRIRLSAALGACTITRECNMQAFEKYNRGMTTVEMIEQIPHVFYETFEKKITEEQEEETE